MSYEQKEGQGVLFTNDKQGNESRPDWKGIVTVNGAQMEIAAWNKASRAGAKYLSISIKPKQQRQQRQPEPPPKNLDENADPGFDDSLPF